jgi:hypothetical protein
MPAGSIEHKGDPLLWSCSHVPGKGGEHLIEEDRLDGRQEPPLGRSGGGPDEATDVEPLVALLHRSEGTLPDRGPHLPNQREQADPMLVGGPEFDRSAGIGGADLGYLVGELC